MMHFDQDDLVRRDFVDMMVGEQLGAGSKRRVYANRLDPETVIKVCAPGTFANVREFEFWEQANAYGQDQITDLLAPCYHISACGLILIQARTTPVRHDELPPRLPDPFTDLKPANWGRWEGRVVCHDYHIMLPAQGKRTRKADWRT